MIIVRTVNSLVHLYSYQKNNGTGCAALSQTAFPCRNDSSFPHGCIAADKNVGAAIIDVEGNRAKMARTASALFQALAAVLVSTACAKGKEKGHRVAERGSLLRHNERLKNLT